MKKLTLIICTLERPTEIQKLCEALHHQTLIPDEILIIDSSKSSNTEKRVAQIKTLPIHYFRVGEKDRGLTRQRNYGIDHAKGDYIAFLDDDTIPDPIYFEEILHCFERHPEAIGVSGYIANEVQWKKVSPHDKYSKFKFVQQGPWITREGYRWRLRKLLGCDTTYPPGWIPPFGHGRASTFLPPDGNDYHVEIAMGGTITWKREVFDRIQFSHYFKGYGLYEDMDFCLRASRLGSIYVCTKAKLAHYHAPSGRPNRFHYGVMVIRNGYWVWRLRWPHPAWLDRFRWYAITFLLIICRGCEIIKKSQFVPTFTETLGRLWGFSTLFFKKQRDHLLTSKSER